MRTDLTPSHANWQRTWGDLQEALVRRAIELPGVSEGESQVSVPGARAFVLDEATARGPAEAFQVAREFAHIHPPEDGSLI